MDDRPQTCRTSAYSMMKNLRMARRALRDAMRACEAMFDETEAIIALFYHADRLAASDADDEPIDIGPVPPNVFR